MNKNIKIIIAIIALVGVAMITYPFLGSIITSVQQYAVINEYNERIAAMEKEELEEAIKAAEEYNKSLLNNSGTSELLEFLLKMQDYDEDNNTYDEREILPWETEDGVIGYIEVPSINLDLPIYSTTSELNLQKGAAHLSWTALPIGGEGTHSVLTGHTGIPERVLFTNINKMEIDDYFYIYALNKKIAYKVDQIEVVLPNDTSLIKAEEGKDYVTLITCTPYGINSHRLLVRGIRDESILKEESNVASNDLISGQERRKTLAELVVGNQAFVLTVAIIAVLAAAIIIALIIIKKRKKKDADAEKS